MPDLFLHPLGWACSAAWFLIVAYGLWSFGRWLFPPLPPDER